MSTPFFTCIIAWVCENVNKNIDLFVYKYIICKSVGFDTDYNISLAYSPCADGPLLMPRRRWLSAWHPESQALAFESKVSESTIGRYRTGKVKHYSEKNVVALCVAMHLPPWLSFKLIEKAGFALAETEEQQAFMTVLTCMFMKSIDEVDEYLKVRGNEPLVQVAA